MNMIFKNGLIWENAHEAKSQVRNYLFWKSTTVDASGTANHLQDWHEILGRWEKFRKLTYWALVFWGFFFLLLHEMVHITLQRRDLKDSKIPPQDELHFILQLREFLNEKIMAMDYMWAKLDIASPKSRLDSF